jgi:ferritin-like metal-binding protein YciE
MSANEKLSKYLREAYEAERDTAEHLAEVVGRTARVDHRVHLESHLEQEREHARLLEARLRELGWSESPVTTVVSVVQGIVGEGIGLLTAPLGALRGNASPADTLRNAEELAAAEALEVARYRALERLAKRAGDAKTAKLAASIRRQEEAQLDLLGREIPHLADDVIGGRAEPAQRPRSGRATGAQQRRKAPARKRRPSAERPSTSRRPTVESSAPSHHPRTHSDTLGPDRADAARIREAEREEEAEESRTVSSDRDADPEGPGAELHVAEPWPGYDGMTATDVAARVQDEAPPVRAAVRLYEAAHERRELVMRATSDD